MKRFIELKDEANKAVDYLSATTDFKPSLKLWDVEFVKWCKTVDEVTTIASENDIDPAQAVYQWLQYVNTQIVLEIFYDFGCEPQNKSKETQNGVEINGTVLFPVQLMYRNSPNNANLGSRTAKNDYLRANYLADIKRGSTTPKNKLLLVYPSDNVADYRKKRLDLENLANKVMAFVTYYKQHELNVLEVGEGENFTVTADVIVM